jgi:hypothetical protein
VQDGTLPEVIRLQDARGSRTEDAAGIGEFWYDPRVWSLPLSPTARVLYTTLCSYLAHREIHRHDLRAALKDHADGEISAAIEDLVHHALLRRTAVSSGAEPPTYEVLPVL